MNAALLSLSAADYHADKVAPEPSLSSSIAKRLLTLSPRHAWFAHPRLNPNYRPEESDVFDYGTAAHAMLLEGSQASLTVVEADDWRTKIAREARDTARAAGKTPILARQLAKVEMMVKVAKIAVEESELSGVFSEGKPEQTLLWKETDIWCRARPDWLTDDHLVMLDYKTTTNAQPDAFIRQMAGMHYDLQAAFYLRGLQAVDPAHDDRVFVFLAQENEPPFACSLVGLSSALLEIAQARVEHAITIWRECMNNKEWPGYPKRVCYAEPTTWQMKEYEESINE